MTEKNFLLEDVDLGTLFGNNDVNLHIIENRFKTPIIVRGNSVILRGELNEVDKIEKIFKEMLYILKRNGNIDEHDVSTIIDLLDINNIKETNESAHHSSNKEKHKNVPSNIIYSGAKDNIKVRNPKQMEYYQKVLKNDLVFAIGPAGTGKTFLAVAMALQALRNNQVSRIIISRPAVEAGESLGYLPGDLQEKIDPYLRPIIDALNMMLSPEKVLSLKEKQILEIIPLAYMRGRTLSNSFIILDEAQNATSMQMKMFLTRLGHNSKAIITGDITQIDLMNKSDSGLVHASKLLQNIDNIDFIYFDNRDVVRHKLVAEIIRAYERETEAKAQSKEKIEKKVKKVETTN